MRGAIGFLIGIIGLCLTGAATPWVTFLGRGRDGEIFVMGMLLIAFVFLNIMVVGFYRVLAHLHEAVLYPEDAFTYPQRGRALFFVGYIGLSVALVGMLLAILLPILTRWRISERELLPIFIIVWFGSWAFLGCTLGGVLMLLSDVFHKAYHRAMMRPPGADGDDYDISRPRRRAREAEADERPRRWDDE